MSTNNNNNNNQDASNSVEDSFINPRHLGTRRQAVKWDNEKDRKLLIMGLGREIRPAEYEMIALTFPEKPTPKSIQERLAKLRREQKRVMQSMTMLPDQAQAQQTGRAAPPPAELSFRALHDPRNAAARFGVHNIPGDPKVAWARAMKRQEEYNATQAANAQEEYAEEEQYFPPTPKMARKPAAYNPLNPAARPFDDDAEDISQSHSATSSPATKHSETFKSEMDEWSTAGPSTLKGAMGTFTRKRQLPHRADAVAQIINAGMGPQAYPTQPAPKRVRSVMADATGRLGSAYGGGYQYPPTSFTYHGSFLGRDDRADMNRLPRHYNTPALETMGNTTVARQQQRTPAGRPRSSTIYQRTPVATVDETTHYQVVDDQEIDDQATPKDDMETDENDDMEADEKNDMDSEEKEYVESEE